MKNMKGEGLIHGASFCGLNMPPFI